MNKTSKFLFLGLTLLILFISVGSISATDNTDTTTTMSDDIALDIHNDMADEKSVVKTAVTTKKVNSENKNVTKKTTKTDKQHKKAVETIQTVNNYETLKTSWNDAQSSNDTTLYTINVKNGRYNFEEELTSNNMSTAKTIIVNGESKDKTIFDGEGKTRFFNLNNTNQIIQFNNITFMNGFNNSQGGAIVANSTLKLNNTCFINNSLINEGETALGGALKVYGNLSIYNSEFINNSVTTKASCANGGAIHASNNSIFYNCSFINNQAIDDEAISMYLSGLGGAIYTTGNSTTSFNIVLCEFRNNSAKSTLIERNKADGGAIYNYYGSLNITSCDFINNSANYDGAIKLANIYNTKSTTVAACAFENNSAKTCPNIDTITK